MSRRPQPLHLAVLLALVALPACAQASDRAGGTADSLRVDDLPLTEVRVGPAARPRGSFAVVLTGDGGWVSSDKKIATALSAHGVPSVGWNARAYLEWPKKPEEAARDLARVVRHYVAAWRRDTVYVVGYSRGADMAPFMVNRLPDALRARVAGVALLSPAPNASFEFHWVDLVRNEHRASDLEARPELRRLQEGTHVLCVYGKDEEESLCPLADPRLVRVLRRDGGHRLVGDDGDELGTLVADWFDGRVESGASSR